MSLLRLSLAAAAALASACAFAATASARHTMCSSAGYSYAGVQTTGPERGLAATITPVREWRVTSGHVAAWVGVGGVGMGPGGQDEWLQIGIAVVPDGTSEVYYEVTLPGATPQYTAVEPVTPDESHRVGIVEKSPNVWVAWLDGHAVSPQFTLPGSHGSWSPIATSESYDGGLTSCNEYSFRLDALAFAPLGGGWQPLAKARRFADSTHTLSTLGVGSILLNRH